MKALQRAQQIADLGSDPLSAYSAVYDLGTETANALLGARARQSAKSQSAVDKANASITQGPWTRAYNPGQGETAIIAGKQIDASQQIQRGGLRAIAVQVAVTGTSLAGGMTANQPRLKTILADTSNDANKNRSSWFSFSDESSDDWLTKIFDTILGVFR